MRGFIQSYDKNRRIGTIVGEQLERLWFHADRVIIGPIDPEINSVVVFEISQKPILPGKLRMAVQIKVEDVTTGTGCLAEQVEKKDAPVKTENKTTAVQS
jgi:hypothetical protein